MYGRLNESCGFQNVANAVVLFVELGVGDLLNII